MLIDVGARSMSAAVLGEPVSMPIGIAPTAYQGLAHPHGELATARAASAAGTLMCLSTMSNNDLRKVRVATSAPLWFQLYIYKDRDATRELVVRAERAGYSALVVTVDAPLLGRRERDVRNRFALPLDLPLPNLPGGTVSGSLDAAASDGAATPEGAPNAAGAPMASHFQGVMDASLSWKDVAWLRGITRLPIILKGILRGDDAELAVEHGASGIVVSNHGGRQLDTAISSIEALPDVVSGAAGRAEVYLDGGVRRGTDVLKALALGARAVLLGRPVVYGLAIGGEEGVLAVLETMRRELDLAMALCGCRSLDEITPDLVLRR
jgi:4-hydroxymandelate oxidase